MKKIITAIVLVLIVQVIAHAQDDNDNARWIKGILHDVETAKQDTTRVLLIADLANYYKFNFPDSSLYYGNKALELAKQIKFVKGEVRALSNIGFTQILLGNESKALQIFLHALKIEEKNNLINDKADLLVQLGRIYNGVNEHTKALDFMKKSKALADSLHDPMSSVIARIWLVDTYLILDQPDSALYYNLTLQSAHELDRQLNQKWIIYQTLFDLGRIQEKKDNVNLALIYFRQSLSLAIELDMVFNSLFAIAQLYQRIDMPDSCIYYANKSLEVVKRRGFYLNIIKANILLSDIYGKSNPVKALQHSKTAIAYKDSIDKLAKTASFENLIGFDEQERQYEIAAANATYRNKIKQWVLIAGLIVFLIIVFILYRNNKQQQKAKVNIEKAYQQLKSTQAQLIQSEKMASLGELTAGIAHEIQNPLNFVNNFSEINKELVAELQNELKTGNAEEAIAISNDIKENEEKINHHGKRADSIVKGMLQHSRVSTGHKEPTDINMLADEYLRLSYHGMRAKDKAFNATIQTDFDNSIEKINIIPQDIGRVLLNLYNNAFYALAEKAKQQTNGYEPLISVSTKKTNDKVEIKVKDNGNGIPQNIVDKIFQPFFTTKPTGQGTGLGLSLSYDIVKAHGGEIKVETKKGEGSEFVIQLMINS